MKLVAKIYEEYKQTGDAFTIDGKNYINVVTEEGVKAVRIFTTAQYNFLAGMQYKKEQIQQERDQLAQSYNEERKADAGFKNGYIVAIIGDTYERKSDLKELGARFSSEFKWHFEGGTEPFPIRANQNFKIRVAGFEARVITWEEASRTMDNGVVKLKTTNDLRELLAVKYETNEDSKYRGELGETIEDLFDVVRVKVVDGPFGRYVINVLEDEYGRVCVWNSPVSEMLEKKPHYIRAVVDDFNIFKGNRQTILTNLEIL